jgi:hypothetical protein
MWRVMGVMRVTNSIVKTLNGFGDTRVTNSIMKTLNGFGDAREFLLLVRWLSIVCYLG